MNTLVLAQGHGFYGSAVAAVEMDFEDVLARFDDRELHELGDGSMTFEVQPDTMVLIRRWDGPSFGPKVLFDTGHAGEDLKAVQWAYGRLEE